jgi:hypothetical protein
VTCEKYSPLNTRTMSSALIIAAIGFAAVAIRIYLETFKED